MAKQFRVAVTLEDDYAEAFSRIECKSRFVAAAIEFYLSVGASLEALKSEIHLLREQLQNGAVPVQKEHTPVEDDDLEKRVDQLIEKTLLIWE